MKKKILRLWILVSGIIISIIGLAHNSFAPAMFRAMQNDQLMGDKTAGFIYFFVLTGTAFFFAGLLTIYSSIGLKNSEKWALIIAISSGIFVALGAISAVLFANFGNPLIYTMGICAILNIVLLLVFSKAFKK